jgi:hypothetical protein
LSNKSHQSGQTEHTEENYQFNPTIHQHFHLREEFEVIDATAKLGGVILRKAELHDFETTYIKVFEKIAEIQLFGTNDILEILGNIGG